MCNNPKPSQSNFAQNGTVSYSNPKLANVFFFMKPPSFMGYQTNTPLNNSEKKGQKNKRSDIYTATT